MTARNVVEISIGIGHIGG